MDFWIDLGVLLCMGLSDLTAGAFRAAMYGQAIHQSKCEGHCLSVALPLPFSPRQFQAMWSSSGTR